MKESKLDNTGYGARSIWYLKSWGPPAEIKKGFMEDGVTRLGVMVFAPGKRAGKPYWIYATNGMSERRMPCEQEPHGDPNKRIELIAYAQQASDWIPDLLIRMAHYPFNYRSGFAIGHTLPITPEPGDLWNGLLLSHPLPEPDDFNPLAIDVGLGGDWVFFAQVIGLKADELELAIKMGGQAFMRDALKKDSGIDLSPLDVDRKSVIGYRRS